MISCHELTVLRPGSDSLLFDEASFDLGEASVAEFVGASGTGKSVLASLMALERRPTEGRLVVGGRQAGRLEADEVAELRQTIGCCRQPPRFLEGRSTLENLIVPLVVRGNTGGAGERAEQLLDGAGLADRAEVRASDLSDGERWLVGLLRAVVGAPELVVLDGALEALGGEMREVALGAIDEVLGARSTLVLFGRETADLERIEATYRLGNGAIRRVQP